MIYVNVGNHFVYALSSLDGAKIWSHNVGSVIDSSIVVGEGNVFGCCWGEFIWALDAQTGAEKWRFNGPGGVQETTPAVVSGVVYVGGHNGRVYALNASTGNKIWEYDTGKPNLWGTTVAGGVVYTGSESGKLFALNASTGTPIWVFNATGLIRSTVVANGMLYYDDQSGFYAIGEHTSNSGQSSNIGFLTVPTVVVSVAVVILVSAGLLVYFKKRKR
jgi:outer membrane protein assembly factor BamB